MKQCDNPTKYERVNKKVARNLYNQGISILMVGCNVNSHHFESGWNLGIFIAASDFDNEGVDKFDSRVNNFKFYLESELGRYPAFYLKK